MLQSNGPVSTVERAQKLQPNAEQVLVAQAILLDWQQDGLDYRRIPRELKAVAKRLVEDYPNNPVGYNELGVLGRHQGRYDEAVNFFIEAIRLSPHSPYTKNLYWNVAFCNVYAGHDREGLEWADRALGAAGSLPSYRIRLMLLFRAAAAYRTGDISTAEHLAKEVNDQYPFDTWREHYPDDP